MSHWTGNFPLLPDELVTSWIVRLALQSGLTPYEFISLVLDSYSIWCRDTDLFLGNKELDQLAAATGIEVNSLVAHGFETFGLTPDRAITPGILSYGVYHRKRRRHGLQYCPFCLLDGLVPFHRREWRFALQFGCDVHGVRLLDGCPHCDAPLMPHRNFDACMINCSECRGSLAAAPLALTETEWAACHAVRQIFLGEDFAVATHRVPRQDLILATRILFSFVTSKRMPNELADEFECSAAKLPVPRKLFDTLETSRISVRAWAIPVCLSMLDAWPDCFVAACRSFDVSQTDVMDTRRDTAPSWLLEGIRKLSHVPRTRRPRRRRPRSKPKHSYKDAFQMVLFDDYLAATPDRKSG